MICPTCRSSIPDNLLACPECAMRKGVAALERYQLQFLPRLLKGEGQLIIAAAQGVRHAQMFGEKRRAFCGTHLPPQLKRTREEYYDDVLDRLCKACRERLAYLMEEAHRAASVSIDATAPAAPE